MTSLGFRRQLGSLQILIVSSILIWLFEQTGILSNLTMLTSSKVTAPIGNWAVTLQIPVRHWYLSITTRSPLIYEYYRLKLDYAKLMAHVSELEGIRSENEILKEQLKLGQLPEDEVLAVPVISYSVPAVSLGKGIEVHQGDLVLVENILVGLVSKVDVGQAEIELFTENSNLGLVVVAQGGADGILKGNGKELILSELNPGHPLQVGEVVRTVGQQRVPADFAVGVVTSIQADEFGNREAVVNSQVSFYDSRIIRIKSIN